MVVSTADCHFRTKQHIFPVCGAISLPCACRRYAFNPANVNQPADTNPTNDKAVLIVTDLKTGKRVRILCYLHIRPMICSTRQEYNPRGAQYMRHLTGCRIPAVVTRLFFNSASDFSYVDLRYIAVGTGSSPGSYALWFIINPTFAMCGGGKKQLLVGYTYSPATKRVNICLVPSPMCPLCSLC